MRDELRGIITAIGERQLPDNPTALFGAMWSPTEVAFASQETYIVDFKDRVPENFKGDFGASIVRLALAFHNTFGGLIVFGVSDKDFKPSALNTSLDVEALSDVISDVSGCQVELLFRSYRLEGSEHQIGALLVPRRGNVPPVVTARNFASYPKGTLWVRDRHSVREAAEAHIPLLFTDRSDLARSVSDDVHHPVHESLPPSPATIQKFIGRKELLLLLWNWFVFENRPRLYLHGPGGSGKSTLAYEFSRTLASRGSQVVFRNGEHLDYVIYISGKETELNTYSATEQPFALRQFVDSASQYRSILVESGMWSKTDVEGLDEEQLIEQLSELFNAYSGLVVIDDVDALSRRGNDTGEESLLFSVLAASKRTRILYTLRFPPSSALNASIMVPALEPEGEFPAFVSACADQFRLPCPSASELKKIAEATSRLPLLAETLVGLRGPCGSYGEALEQFNDRGGDEARQYLYQREYDRLEPRGRSREVLAALLLLDGPVTFPVLTRMIGLQDGQVRDAISECGSVFLATQDDGKGETSYQLASPARGYISNVSSGLQHFATIKRRVELYLSEESAYTPEESALIVQIERLVRAKRFKDAIDVYEARDRRDPVLTNQKVQALVGQAYANLGPDYRTKARECFKAAHDLKFFDIFMARGWFFVENASEYGNKAAIEVCENVLRQPKLSARYKAEFKSKLASCYYEEAIRMRSVSSERTIELYRLSILNYLSALWIGRYTEALDNERTLRWLSQPAYSLAEYLKDDSEPFFRLISDLPAQKHDVHLDGAEVLLHAMFRLKVSQDNHAKARFAGLMRRTIKALQIHVGDSDVYPGFQYLLEQISRMQAKLAEVTHS